MYNSLGDNITKNFRRFREPDINSNAIAEWYNQMSSGKGPIYLHIQESGETKNETMMFTMWDRPYGLPFWETNFRKCAEEAMEHAYAPLIREEGIHPKVVMDELLHIMGPVENSVYMNDYRLNIALRKLEALKEKVGQMRADDFHWMLTCHEAEAMVLCAEMQLRASLMRKESRGWFLREDYPQMDNQNWLKYIVVKNVDGEMTFGTEDVPYEKWDVKPPMMH